MPIRPKLDRVIVGNDIFAYMVSDLGREFFEVEETVVGALFSLGRFEYTLIQC